MLYLCNSCKSVVPFPFLGLTASHNSQPGICILQVCILQVCILQVCILQVCILQVCILQVCI